jgi:hypothetical protein
MFNLEARTARRQERDRIIELIDLRLVAVWTSTDDDVYFSKVKAILDQLKMEIQHGKNG